MSQSDIGTAYHGSGLTHRPLFCMLGEGRGVSRGPDLISSFLVRSQALNPESNCLPSGQERRPLPETCPDKNDHKAFKKNARTRAPLRNGNRAKAVEFIASHPVLRVREPNSAGPRVKV